MKKNNKGFTLVELIVVIAVLAVITVLSAPLLVKYVEKARIGTDENAVGEVAHAAEVAFVKIGRDAGYNTMKIRIDGDGDAEYQSSKSKLVIEVNEIIAKESYKYKSDLYRGKTVVITVDPETGVATYVDPETSFKATDNDIISGFLWVINGFKPLTDTQKDNFDIAFSDGVSSVEEFFKLPASEQKDQVQDLWDAITGSDSSEPPQQESNKCSVCGCENCTLNRLNMCTQCWRPHW